MPTLGLAALSGAGDWGALFRNLAWTIPGNVVGGGVLVGLAYAWMGTPARAVEPAVAGRAELVTDEAPAAAVA